MNRSMVAAVAAALILPLSVQTVAAQTTGAANVAVEQSDKHGAYLADADGRALYMFTADKQGADGAQAASNCYDACAEAWPPLLTDGEPQAAEQVDASMLGTIERQGGAMQVTYNGWPLYYYVRDQGPGEATGQDVHGFGGEWYLVAPSGEKVEEG